MYKSATVVVTSNTITNIIAITAAIQSKTRALSSITSSVRLFPPAESARSNSSSSPHMNMDQRWSTPPTITARMIKRSPNSSNSNSSCCSTGIRGIACRSASTQLTILASGSPARPAHITYHHPTTTYQSYSCIKWPFNKKRRAAVDCEGRVIIWWATMWLYQGINPHLERKSTKWS